MASSVDDDVVPRKLTPEALAMLRPHPTFESAPTDLLLAQLIGVLLESKGLNFTQPFVERLADVAVLYMHGFAEKVKKFTELQRRSRPSLVDVANTFRVQKTDPTDIYEELELGAAATRNSPALRQLHARAAAVRAPPDEPSRFANQTYEITQLVPRHMSKPSYIPAYLPELPPDYTYRNTPKFTATLTDSEKLRLKLVQESRLTETSLYNLIDSDWRSSLESELVSSPESIMEEVEFSEPPTPPEPKPADLDLKAGDKAFDFVEYARKRRQAAERLAQQIEHRRSERAANIYIQAERYMSPYATREPREVRRSYRDVLRKSLVSVVRAVRAQETQKAERIAELQAAKAERQQRAKSQETIEFGFNFGEVQDLSDDSEDIDMDDIVFGEPEPTLEPTPQADAQPESTQPPEHTPQTQSSPAHTLPSPEPPSSLALDPTST